MNKFEVVHEGNIYTVQANSQEEADNFVKSGGALQRQQPMAEAQQAGRATNIRFLPKEQSVGQMIGQMATEAGAEAAGAAIGQSVGAPFAPATLGASVPVGGAIGATAGYLAGKAMTGQSPTIGEAAAAAITGAIPGATQAKMAARTGANAVARIAAKEALINVGAAATQTALDRGELPSAEQVIIGAGGGAAGALASPAVSRFLTENKPLTKAIKKDIDTAVQQETTRLATERGIKILPSSVKSNQVVGALEFLAGPSDTVREYAHKNAAVTLALVRKELGMPVDAVIDIPAIKAVKAEAGAAYDEAAKVSPRAATALEEFKKNRDFAQSYFLSANQLTAKQRTEALEQAKAYQAKADAYWKVIAKEADASGKKGPGGERFIDYLEAQKKRYAKAAIVEEAFGEGSGVVAANIISKARENGGKLLDGELQVIHRLAQAFPREMADPAGKSLPSVSFNRLVTLGAASGAVAGGATGYLDPATAATIAAFAASAPRVARSALSSDAIQKNYLNRSFVQNLPPDFTANLTDKYIKSASRTQKQEEPALVAGFKPRTLGRTFGP
jgi:hypothetical protein